MGIEKFTDELKTPNKLESDCEEGTDDEIDLADIPESAENIFFRGDNTVKTESIYSESEYEQLCRKVLTKEFYWHCSDFTYRPDKYMADIYIRELNIAIEVKRDNRDLRMAVAQAHSYHHMGYNAVVITDVKPSDIVLNMIHDLPITLIVLKYDYMRGGTQKNFKYDYTYDLEVVYDRLPT